MRHTRTSEHSHKRPPKSSAVRIIGGRWRSRKIAFDTNSSIRPTPDSVRETLFNWLSPYIDGAHCLDLYAGSGALGFEAASRGAGNVVIVENSRRITAQLQLNKEKLEAVMVEIINNNVEEFLQKAKHSFDIVFLDPPYQLGIIESICQSLEQSAVLKQTTMIYLETEKQLKPLPIPAGWHIIHQQIQGAVAYHLISTDR